MHSLREQVANLSPEVRARLLDPNALQRAWVKRECVRDFKVFVRHAWGVIDPDPLVWGPHIEHICNHLQAVTEGKIRRLIINIPPGHAKSMLVSVLWPVWVWIRNPAWRALTASYGMELAIRDATKSRALIESEWYVDHFARDWKVDSDKSNDAFYWAMEKDQNAKSFYQNSKKGFRLCLSVGGKGTGFRGDCQIIDDPLNAADAMSKIERLKAIRWLTETMSSRLNNQKTDPKVIIMQRLHEEDPTGFLLANARNDWEFLCLPSEFDPSRRYKTSIGTDWRTEEGEPLFPEKYPKEILAEIKRPGTGMGSMAYAGQHQQRPAPAEGGMIKREWFSRRWVRRGPEQQNALAMPGVELLALPPKFDELSIFVDAAFKKLEDNDRVAIGVVGRKGPDKFLVDLKWDRMGFVETVQAITDLLEKWDYIQHVNAVCIEDKANGSAVIEVLKARISRIIPIEPDGGKEARVSSVTGELEARNFILPANAPWVSDAIEEAVAFPKAAHDDFIDMVAYALLRMGVKSGRARFAALAKW